MFHPAKLRRQLRDEIGVNSVTDKLVFDVEVTSNTWGNPRGKLRNVISRLRIRLLAFSELSVLAADVTELSVKYQADLPSDVPQWLTLNQPRDTSRISTPLVVRKAPMDNHGFVQVCKSMKSPQHSYLCNCSFNAPGDVYGYTAPDSASDLYWLHRCTHVTANGAICFGNHTQWMCPDYQ